MRCKTTLSCKRIRSILNMLCPLEFHVPCWSMRMIVHDSERETESKPWRAWPVYTNLFTIPSVLLEFVPKSALWWSIWDWNVIMHWVRRTTYFAHLFWCVACRFLRSPFFPVPGLPDFQIQFGRSTIIWFWQRSIWSYVWFHCSASGWAHSVYGDDI